MERRKALYQQYESLLHHIARLREEADFFAQAAAILRHALMPDMSNGNGQLRPMRGPVLGNLPMPLGPLIGREGELPALKALMRNTRLLLLVGPFGCGKTRLASELACTSSDLFPDGVWWIDIHDVGDRTAVPRAVAAALRLRARARDRTLNIVGRLRHAHALLVLDNCEHQIPACAAMVETVLNACPHLRVIATSRERLGLAGEVRWPVRPLAAPPRDVRLSVEEALTFNAVRLFDRCARALIPGFTATPDNVDAIVEICARLDGLPLAIEMAAARLPNLSLQQIAGKLDDRFALLTGARQGAPAYHRTLRASVARSYDMLSPSERTLFNLVSTFAGRFGLEDVEAAASHGSIDRVAVLDLVSRLTDKSMVEVQMADDGRVVYSMLETLQEYGRARLAEAVTPSTTRSG